MGDNDTLLMVLLWVLGGVCVAGKWREPGHWHWHCDQTDRTERGLCLLGFKLAQAGREGGALGDDENGKKEREGGLKSVGEGDRLNESKLGTNGGPCLDNHSQEVDWMTQFYCGMQLTVGLQLLPFVFGWNWVFCSCKSTRFTPKLYIFSLTSTAIYQSR